MPMYRAFAFYPAVNHLVDNTCDLKQVKTVVRHGLGIRREDELLLIRSAK